MTQPENTSEKRIEKQRFYLAEFEQEAAWLSRRQKEGWRLVSAAGTRYTFEVCEKEEWEYRIDLGERNAGPQSQEAKDWEPITKCGAWGLPFERLDRHSAFQKFYFRRKQGDGAPFLPDISLRMEQLERIIKSSVRRSAPFLLGILAYEFLIWGTPLLKTGGVFSLLLTFAAVLLMVLVVYGFYHYIGQLDRLQKRKEKLENGEDDSRKVPPPGKWPRLK